MNKILVLLPANRDFAGTLEIQNAAGKRIAGPFRVCGRADDEAARKNKNPGRDPLLPFGDLPFGEYQILKIIPTGEGTPYAAEEFGSAGMVLMRPKSGDAALADANGRFGFFIHSGARSRKRLLRPTQDGSLRLADGDQRRFLQALRKMGEGNSFCLVVSTAKVGAKVAVAAQERPRGNTSASLLLASSVAASAITGAVRQVVVRNLFPNIGASIAAAGIAFVAEHHASAQTGDYGSASSSSASTSSENTSSSSDTSSSSSSASDTGSSSGTSDMGSQNSGASETSASGPSDHSTGGGDTSNPGSSDTGNSSGSSESTSSAGTDNSGGSEAGGATTSGGSDMGAASSGSSDSSSSVDTSGSGTGVSDTPSTTDAGNAGSSSDVSGSDNTPHLKDSLPGIYLNDTTGHGNDTPYGISGLSGINVNGPRSEDNATGPSDTTLRPMDGRDGITPPGQPESSSSDGTENSSGSGTESSASSGIDNSGGSSGTGNSSASAPGSQSQTSGGSPADAAVVEYDNQNNQNSQSGQQPIVGSGEDLKDAVGSQPSPQSTPAPAPNAMDQLNAVDQNSQNAVHASSDEEAHAQAAQGFDTSSSGTPPVYLNSDQGVVSPDAASGGTPSAGAAGMAPGSPIIDEGQSSSSSQTSPQPGSATQPVSPNSDFSVGTSDTTANNLPSPNPGSTASYNGDAVVTKALTMKDTWNADDTLTYKQIPKENYPAVSPNISADNTSDCSHFVNEVLQNSGHNVPYVSTAQIGSDSNYQEIPAAQAQPGDIIVQYQTDGEGHMGIYTGQKVRAKDGKLYPYGVGFGTSDMVSEAPWSATGGSGTAVSSGGTIKYYHPLK